MTIDWWGALAALAVFLISVGANSRAHWDAHGTLKLINVPNSVFTEVDGIAPGGLITGRTATNGFTATCH